MPQHSAVTYLCRRCGYGTGRYENYVSHTKRKKPCQTALSDIVPSKSNFALKYEVTFDRGTPDEFKVALSNSDRSDNTVAAPSGGTTNINANNSIVFNINMPQTNIDPMPFPRQNIEHMSMQSLKEICMHAGKSDNIKDFADGVYRIFESSFSMNHPHNINALFFENKPYALVFKDGGWISSDPTYVVKRLIETCGMHIVDTDDENEHLFSASCRKNIQFHYDENVFMDDVDLQDRFKNRATAMATGLPTIAAPLAELVRRQAAKACSVLRAPTPTPLDAASSGPTCCSARPHL